LQSVKVPGRIDPPFFRILVFKEPRRTSPAKQLKGNLANLRGLRYHQTQCRLIYP